MVRGRMVSRSLQEHWSEWVMNRNWLYAPLGWMAHAVALLPLRVLYVLADVVYFLAYHVAGYRRNVVERHIADSFPDKSVEEQRRIVKDFYHNFADYIVETIKLLHISDKQMMRRMTFTNLEAIESLLDRDIQVMVLFSHCFNWEWAPSVTRWLHPRGEKPVEFGQVYRPLKNKWMDGFMLHLRSRFGSRNYPMNGVLRELLKARREGRRTTTGFMSDQKPIWGDVRHVIDFMHHPTPTLLGSEELASKLKMGVVYWDISKVSRGHYNIDVIPVADNAADTATYEITDRYFELLSRTINRQPALWLWSHKRWKYPYAFEPDGTPIYDSKSVR